MRTPQSVTLGGFQFQADHPTAHAKPKRVRVEKPKVKINPQLAAKARELRDRCMERQEEWLPRTTRGKYNVSRAITAAPVAAPTPLLPAA